GYAGGRARTLAPGTRSLRTRGKTFKREKCTPKAVRGVTSLLCVHFRLFRTSWVRIAEEHRLVGRHTASLTPAAALWAGPFRSWDSCCIRRFRRAGCLTI